MLPYGHTQKINNACFSKDGKKILTCSDDKTVKIWNTRTGGLLCNFANLKGMATSASFSPDGKKIIIGQAEMEGAHYTNSIAILIDVETGKSILQLKGHKDLINYVEFSSDGKRIVSAAGDGTVIVWNAYNGDSIAIFHHKDLVKSAHFSHDGKKLLTASRDNTARVWDIVKKKELFALIGHSNVVSSAEFSPDENKIVTASLDSTIIIWDARSGKALNTLKGHTAYCRMANFSPDGKYIISASDDDIPKIWDADNGRLLYNLNKEGYRVDKKEKADGQDFISAKFSPDSKYAATTSYDGYIRIWDTKNGKLIHRLEGHKGYISSINFSFDSLYLLSSSFDLSCKLWDLNSGENIQTFEGHSNITKFCSFSPDGQFILGTSFQTVKVWDSESGKLLYDLDGKNGIISSSQFSTDGQFIATVSNNGRLKIWSTFLKEIMYDVNTYIDHPYSVSFSLDGKYVIVGGYNDYDLSPSIGDWQNKDTAKEKMYGFAKVYSSYSSKKVDSLAFPYAVLSASLDKNQNLLVATYNSALSYNAVSGKLEFALQHDDFISTASYSPDGKYIATAYFGKNAILWNAKTRDSLHLLSGHTGAIYSATFSNDGEYIVTASEDKTAKVWQTSNGKLVATLSGHANYLSTASFSPDGKKVITASDDNTIKVWNTFTGDLLFTLISIDEHDFLILNPKGYYAGSKESIKQLHYVDNHLNFIGFEQLDLKYNRPDIILQSLGNKNNLLIDAYQQTYLNRLERYHLSPNSFTDNTTLPEAEIINKELISYNQHQQNIKLRIHASSYKSPLINFNLWVNEVPLFGSRGLRINRPGNKPYDTTITVLLTDGKNKIETSVTNSNGLENYRYPLYVNYAPVITPASKIYFIGIAVNKYADALHNNLKFPLDDIRSVITGLQNKSGNRFIIDTLFNNDFNVSNLKRLKKKLSVLGVNDKVIIAYSGHGAMGKDGKYYFPTSTMTTIDFAHVEGKAISYEALEELLDVVPARNKLFLIDACYSGIIDAQAKSFTDLNTTTSQIMEELFSYVGRGTGATVISASSGNAESQESAQFKHGFFTQGLLNAIKKFETITVSRLKDYILSEVPIISKNKQQPTIRSENREANFKIW
ncbi:hypothetical protein GCM10027043_05310 [Ferruginibacter profundus]